MSQKEHLVGPYVLQHMLGEGTTGKVKLAYHRETGEQVAIKIISKQAFDEKPNLQMKVRREIALMKVVNHPNILKLIDVYESARNLYIVLEYAQKGELFDFLVARRSLPEDMALDFFRQIILALEYLHMHGICHRDLKPENILLDSNNRIKIADFGFARWVKRNITETSCGSPHYAAPEVIRGVPYDGRVADIWSMGIILFALLAGYLPFDDPSIRTLLHKVKKGVFEMPAFPEDICDLIRSMLTVDPAFRATMSDIKSHRCFRRDLDMTYILPSPIPFGQFATPIAMSELPVEIVNVLVQIGYVDEQELRDDLETTENTMAKVFVAMLTAQQDLEMLPWDEASIGSACALGSGSFMSPVRRAFELDSDPFHRSRRAAPQAATPDHGSMVTRPDWCVDTTLADNTLRIVEREIYGKSVWNLMCCAQEAAGDCGFQYFHPDPITLVVRSIDGLFFASINAVFTSCDELQARVMLHKGSSDMFDEFMERFAVLLRQ